MELSPLRGHSPCVASKSSRCLAPGQPLDTVCHGPSEDRELSWGQRASRGLLLGCGAAGALLGIAGTAQAQQVQVQVKPQRGVRFDMTEQQANERTRNTLTAEQIPDGQPHFTAWDVDPGQSTKRYHDPNTLAVDDQHSGRTLNEGPSFQQCARPPVDGVCQTAKPNQIRYSVLSCVYYKQEDDQFYRVTHKSYQHNYTHAMQRNVCGGHELRYKHEEMTYFPEQVNKAGDQLFLNPANILKIEQVARPLR